MGSRGYTHGVYVAHLRACASRGYMRARARESTTMQRLFESECHEKTRNRARMMIIHASYVCICCTCIASGSWDTPRIPRYHCACTINRAAPRIGKSCGIYQRPSTRESLALYHTETSISFRVKFDSLPQRSPGAHCACS